MSQQLLSEDFNFCRLCLRKPEQNKNLNFLDIFQPLSEGKTIMEYMKDLLDLNVQPNDQKPRTICEICYISIVNINATKIKAVESTIIIDYLTTKKFANTLPKTSIASTSTLNKRNNEKLIQGFLSTHPHLISEQSNNNETNLDGSSSINNSSKSFIENHSNSALIVDIESDDDCCIVTPIETIVLSDDEDDEDCKYVINIENEQINVDLPYNVVTESFFTCPARNSNVLSISEKYFTPYYQLLNDMSSLAVMCRQCFQQIEKSNFDGNERHIRCGSVDAFKCCLCNITLNGKQEFAFHKLKIRNGYLMNIYGVYVCIPCKVSSPDLPNTITNLLPNQHTMDCPEYLTNNETAHSIKLSNSTVNGTELVPTKNVMVHKNGNKNKITFTSKLLLFTCLRPSCNLIFHCFEVFRSHYLEHCEIRNKLVCWQCCVSFSDASSLKIHQYRQICHTPGQFNCYKCLIKFDDIQSLSVHKLTYHNGDLIANSKYNKIIVCTFCKVAISIYKLKSHVVTCQEKMNSNSLIQNRIKSNNTLYHRQFVCSSSVALKVITSNPDATRKSQCLQKISHLESPDCDPLDGSDAAIDPNEPRYCLCDQVAFGTMIACDHEECTIEWFHYDCVGILKPPRGKWYCPKCRNTIKKHKMSKKKPCKT